MRNLCGTEECLEYAYTKTMSTDSDGQIPRSEELAKLFDQVKALNEVVPVDIHIPGCPPRADTIWFALTELLAGRIPELSGSTLSYD
jgi:NAD-reducing hydrogenase small subunit